MYASSNAALLNKYQSDSVMTASPIDLVIMLYEALIKQVKLADIFMEQGDYEKANQHLTKAQDIVSELLHSLDLRYSIASDLMRLYDFLLQELVQINLHKERDRIPGILEVVGGLRYAWVAIRNAGDGRAYAIEE
ncbi:MAG: flagellar export chaperone FliS [Candidatus Pelethousia sp.]|nr:flagellar export chaperone FliS [Candidatus Pelethousia sp.]